MRIRQPRVDGEYRHFDTEGNGESDEQPDGSPRRQRVGPHRFQDYRVVKRLIDEIQRDNRDPRQQTADGAITDISDRGIDATLGARDADQEYDWHQRRFEE